MKKTTKTLWMALAMLMLMVSCTKKSSEKEILSFRFVSPNVEAFAEADGKTLVAEIPSGTDVTNLVPVILISEKATINPGSGVLMDFTNPVTYTVTAEDGSQALYTVIVTVEEPAVNEQSFVGTWGVEKIEYYNIDYAGNPITASMVTYEYDLFDGNKSIQLVFRQDRTGELRNSSIDTIWMSDGTFICCPDTTIVTAFTYSYDYYDSVLFMNMANSARPFRLQIVDLTDDLFVYENECDFNYVEKAYLKRLSYTPSKSTGKKSQYRPRKQGSLLGKR